jgi:hypothetical protein
MTYLVLRNFHVFALTGEKRIVNGEEYDVEKRVDFRRGMVIQDADIPAGHSADGEGGWIAKGHIRDTSAPAPALEAPAVEDGPA